MKNVLWIEGNRVQNLYTPHDEICLDIREYFASGLYAVRETRYDGIILNPRTPFMRGTDVPELLDVEEDPEIQEILERRCRDRKQWWEVPAYFIRKVKQGVNNNTPIIGFRVYDKEEEEIAREQLLTAGMQDLITANGDARADLEKILQRF